MLALCTITSAFVAPSATRIAMPASALSGVSTPPVMLDIPRITLPDVVSDLIKVQDLKSPNELSTSEYNSYSGAAIGGTLLFFLVPGGAAFGIGDAISTVVKDFVFSALIGGGAGAYLALRQDHVATYASNFGKAVLAVPGAFLGSPVDVPRITLPDIVSGLIKEQGLTSPNDLTTEEYNAYSGAAIGSTLLFFLLPGGAVFGLGSVPGQVLSDFVFSALLGGGVGAYVSLRKDAPADYANQFGEAVLAVPAAVLDSKDGTTE